MKTLALVLGAALLVGCNGAGHQVVSSTPPPTVAPAADATAQTMTTPLEGVTVTIAQDNPDRAPVDIRPLLEQIDVEEATFRARGLDVSAVPIALSQLVPSDARYDAERDEIAGYVSDTNPPGVHGLSRALGEAAMARGAPAWSVRYAEVAADAAAEAAGLDP